MGLERAKQTPRNSCSALSGPETNLTVDALPSWSSLEGPPQLERAAHISLDVQSEDLGPIGNSLLQRISVRPGLWNPLFSNAELTGSDVRASEGAGAPQRARRPWLRPRLPTTAVLYRLFACVVLVVAGAHAFMCGLFLTTSLGAGVGSLGASPVRYEPKFFPAERDGVPRWWEPSDPGPLPLATLQPLLVPRIIHQTYRLRALPKELHPLVRSWQISNPGWQIRFYDDAACMELVRREFPQYLSAYQALPKNVERSDFFRYMVVLRYGGVYADIDTECKAPLDQVIRPKDALITGWESEVSSDEEAFKRHYVRKRQILQWVFAAAPGHPALQRVCDHIASNAERTFSNNTNRDTLERTGPGAWTDAVLGHAMGRRLASPDDPWNVRVLPRVAFGVHPAGVDGLTIDSPGIVVQHHFLGSWKMRGGWNKGNLLSGALGVLGWKRALPADTIKDLGTDIFPVSASFEPPFLLFVNLKGQGDIQSGTDVSSVISSWGSWQAGLDPARTPRVVDTVVGSLGTMISDLVLVDIGAGLGLFSLAAAARGHRAIAFEVSSYSLPAFRESVAANGFQKLVDVRPISLGVRNETICVDHDLQSLKRPGRWEELDSQWTDFRRGYGDAEKHAKVDGCRRLVQRGTLDTLLEEDIRIGAIRISTSGWAAWVLEGGLQLIKRHMPNIIHIEFSPGAMRQAGHRNPGQMLGRLRDVGYKEAYHAGPICDERWFNITKHTRLQGPNQWSARMEEKLKQPTWCNLPVEDFQLIVDRAHNELAENVLFVYREEQGLRPEKPENNESKGAVEGTDAGATVHQKIPSGTIG